MNKVELQDPMLPHMYRIQEFYQETHDTFTFSLESEDGTACTLCKFAPGQFNMLYLFGIGEVPISISGDPGNPQTFVHTVRAVGTVTKMMQKMKRGDLMGLRGPFGFPWPVEAARGRDVVLVAGGIGLAPLRPVLYHIFSHRDEYKNVSLLAGFRTPQDILFQSELYEWQKKFDIDVRVTVDAATRGWHGHVGVVTTLIPETRFDATNTLAMMCGPEVMMRFTIRDLESRGVRQDDMYVSMERNMKCAVGFCGHCQYGPTFICKDGPVFSFPQIKHWFGKREI